jgi:hypothetical protein
MVDLQGIGGNGLAPLSPRSGDSHSIAPKTGESFTSAPHGADEVFMGTPCRKETARPEALPQAAPPQASAITQDPKAGLGVSSQLFASEGYFLSGTAGVPAQDKEFPGDDLAINSPFTANKEQGFISATGQPINYKFIFQE